VLDLDHAETVLKQIAIARAISRGFAAASDRRGEYRTGHQEQLYIETNG